MSAREGRFEIIIEDKLDDLDQKVGATWHTRWRADGNLLIVNSSELLTSKRNALNNIARSSGVASVTVQGNYWGATLVDGSQREIRIIDLRST